MYDPCEYTYIYACVLCTCLNNNIVRLTQKIKLIKIWSLFFNSLDNIQYSRIMKKN